jgi:hypothetical protein
MTDRELIERLLFLAETAEDYFIYCELRELAAALEAKPEPQGPTEMEIIAFWSEHCAGDGDAGILRLARWGRPAIEPVPVSERPPGPKDCDAEGLCWWWSRDITAWCLCFAADGDSSEWTHWLPHWALPVPAPANTINQNNY